jgi:hypothetical protein
MGRFTKKDAARLTRVSPKYVAATWHNARNDARGTKYQSRPEKKQPANYKRKKHGPHQR